MKVKAGGGFAGESVRTFDSRSTRLKVKQKNIAAIYGSTITELSRFSTALRPIRCTGGVRGGLRI